MDFMFNMKDNNSTEIKNDVYYGNKYGRRITGRIQECDVTSVTSPDGRYLTTNEGICGEFRDYNQKNFTCEPSLSYYLFS